MILSSSLSKMSVILVLTVVINFSASSQESKSYLIDSVQLSRANQNFVYAQGCKEIKDTLFIALDTALSIIESQKLQINAQDSAKAKCDAKYQLLQDDEAAAKKQIKKEKRLRKVNGFLLYATTAASIILAALYILK